jgi:hypothetical protein
MVKKNSDDRNIDRTYGIATSDTALKEMMNKLEQKYIPEYLCLSTK